MTTAGPGSDVKDELREAARAVLERKGGWSAGVRALLDDPTGHDPGLWERMCELGWPGIAVPVEHGGAGGTVADLAVVLEAIGRYVTPSPLASSAVLAAGAIAAAGSDDQQARLLPALAAGERKATVALSGPDGRIGPRSLGMTLSPSGAGYRLSGAAGYVPDAHVASDVVVATRDGGGRVALVAVPAAALHVAVVPTVDQTRRLCTVRADGIELEPGAVLSDGPAGEATYGHVVDLAALTLACDGVGGAERVMEMTVGYAKERVQFGRPIGSFQAVKHRCTDMLILVEASRVAADHAAERVGGGAEGASVAASTAKAYAADAYAKVAADGVQLHGGIGFTWEHDMHLYLKRAKLNQALFGSPAWHRERVASLVLPAASASGH